MHNTGSTPATIRHERRGIWLASAWWEVGTQLNSAAQTERALGLGHHSVQRMRECLASGASLLFLYKPTTIARLFAGAEGGSDASTIVDEAGLAMMGGWAHHG